MASVRRENDRSKEPVPEWWLVRGVAAGKRPRNRAAQLPARLALIDVDLWKGFGYYHPLNGTELGNGGRLLAGRQRPATVGGERPRRGWIGGPEPPAPPVPNRGGQEVKRTKGYLMALAGFGGMLLLAGTSWGQAPGGAAPPPAGTAPANTARPTIAVFNMAAVMREFGQAKYQVHQLNEKRKSMSTQVVAWWRRLRQVAGRHRQATGARAPR